MSPLIFTTHKENHTHIALGYGGNLSIVFNWTLHENVEYWDLSTRTGHVTYDTSLTYQPPSLIPRTLKLRDATLKFSQDNSFSYVTLDATTHATGVSWLTFNGNFGHYIDDARVFYRDKWNDVNIFECKMEVDLEGYVGSMTSSKVECRTDPSTPPGFYNFYVSLTGGAESVVGLDTFYLAQPPEITHVEGCSASEFNRNGTYQCPTQGDTELTVTGINFYEGMVILYIVIIHCLVCSPVIMLFYIGS